MDEKTTNIEQPVIESAPAVLKPKIFLFGLPIFIIQLIAVYFITANFLISKLPDDPSFMIEQEQTDSVKNEPVYSSGKYIYTIEDVIVNPANTEGKRLLLASFGFDLNDENASNELKNKDALIKDIIISALSSKTLEQLNQSEYKDSIKIQILGNVKKAFTGINVNNIYISKYIIQ